MELTKIIVAGVSTVALAGGIGAGLAYADTPPDEPTSSPTVTSTSSPTETTPRLNPTASVIRTGSADRFLVGICGLLLGRYMGRSRSLAKSIG